MAFVHDDDDDPFYDHDEALAHAAATSGTTVAPSVRPSAVSRAATVSAVRASHHRTAAARPTLSRSTSAGRSTTTFDAFLSDSSDDDSSDDDDGSAIQRMQEQADDMEYIDTAFQLDSPNGCSPSDGAGDTSFRMDAPPLPLRLQSDAQLQRGTVVSADNTVAQATAGGGVAAWARRMSRAASQHSGSGSDSDGDSDASTECAATRPFTGRHDSFAMTRKRDASVDTLDSSFRLFSSTAALAAAVAGSVDSASYLSSGDFSDSSFVLSSPPTTGTYFDDNDDSFTGDRPSALDTLFNERLDDSFIGARPSNLSLGSRGSIDNSFTGDRPSNLSLGSRRSVDDSFIGERPSDLSLGSRSSIDKSFTGERPSDLDRGSRSSIGNAFIGEGPASLLHEQHDAVRTSDVRDEPVVEGDVLSDSESDDDDDDDDEPLSMLHLPDGIDSSDHCATAQYQLSSPNAVRPRDKNDSSSSRSSSTSADADTHAFVGCTSDAPAGDDALLSASAAVVHSAAPAERRSSTQALAVETSAAVVQELERTSSSSVRSGTSADNDALALSYLSDPADDALKSVAHVFQLDSPNRPSAHINTSACADPAPSLVVVAVSAPAPSAAVVQTTECPTNDDSAPTRLDVPAAVAVNEPAPVAPALERQRLSSASSEASDCGASSVCIEVLPPPPSVCEQPSVPTKPDTGVASWVRRLSRLAPSDDDGNEVSGSDSDRDSLDKSPQWAFAALSERSDVPLDEPTAAVTSAAVPPSRATTLSTAPSGFQWHDQLPQRLQHADSRSDESSSGGGGLSLKESIWHQASIPRPTRLNASATSFHRFSTSLRSTLQRTGARLFGHSPPQQAPQFGQSNEPTSPKSVCSSPPKLARSFDDRNFYARFARGGGVDDTDELVATKRALGRQYTAASAVQKRRARTIVLLLCALLGVGVGIALVHIDAFAAAFTPASSGSDDSVATATQWLLLPGTLFLRLWHCVAMPLVFCHVLTGTADLVLNGKARLALSVRSIGCMLAVSAVTTLEGVGLMAAIQYLGLFRTPASSAMRAQATATELSKTLGAVTHVRGTVALLCESEQRTYLQSLNRGQSFQCSNASSPSLPTAVASNATTTTGQSVPSAALFVLHDVHSVLPRTPSPGLAASYYPSALTLDQVSHGVVDALVPHNIAQSLLDATPVSTIALALLLGLVCGKRAYERSIAAQHEDAAVGASRGVGTPLLGTSVADKPHYVLGAVVELQLALEWLVEALEPLAPVGALSLLAGTIALYRTELLTFVAPMLALVLSVAVACAVHVLVVTPVAMKLSVDVNVFATWGQAFVPAYVMCFSTESVVLSLPTVQQCYATQSARIAPRAKRSGLTKSMAQASVSVLSVLHRNAHALYYPIALLWLLETSARSPDTSADALTALTTHQCVLIAVLTLASCFVALHSVVGAVSSRPGRSNVLLIATLWRAVLTSSSSTSGVLSSAAATAMPPTLPLLMACDVLLARVVAMVNLHGNLVVARLIAEHCDEVVVQASEPSNSIDLAASPMYL